jgi:hypothetical protein
MYGFRAVLRGVRMREERSARMGDWGFMISVSKMRNEEIGKRDTRVRFHEMQKLRLTASVKGEWSSV